MRLAATSATIAARRAKQLNSCQARFVKISVFPKRRNYDLKKPSRPHEGRFAIVTIRGAGCDGRVAAQDVRRDAYGQAVWS
jgi:hypothetical protein